MSGSVSILKRCGGSGLAAVTLVAGLPLFLGTAQAAHVAPPTTSQLDGNTVAAAACKPYRVALPPTGADTTVGELVNVVLDDLGTSDTFNAGFCVLPLTSSGITFTPAVGMAVRSAGPRVGGGSVDESRFTTVAGRTVNQGEVVIGVTANEPGIVRAQAYYDANNDNLYTSGEPIQSVATSLTVTVGGIGKAAQEAVAVVEVVHSREAPPPTNGDIDSVVQGETRSYQVYAGNNTSGSGRDPILGAHITYSSDGTNGPFAPTSLGTTNNSGVASGTITFPANADDRRLTFYVNRPSGLDSTYEPNAPGNEKADTSEVSITTLASQTGKTVTLSADNQNIGYSANNPAVNAARTAARPFTALVDANDTEPGTGGTLLAIAVSGGSGDERVTSIESATSATGDVQQDGVTRTTDPNDSGASFQVIDPTPLVGQTLTVSATIRGTSQVATSTLRFRNVPADARNIASSPKTATTASNAARTFTSTVSDVDGQPVSGVTVNFTETGVGTFVGGASSLSAVTNAAGQATADTVSVAGQTGAQTITGRIDDDADQVLTGDQMSQCNYAANVGSDPQGNNLNSTDNTGPAGNCADSSTHTYAVPPPPPSPSPAPSVLPTASPSGSASPTLSPTTSPTTTPTASTSPGPASPSATPSTATPACAVPARVVLASTTIIATGHTGVSVTAPAGSVVDLLAYSRPSSTYRIVRTGTTDSTGRVVFSALAPPSNTRLYAQVRGCTASTVTGSVVLNVRTALSLFAQRTGPQSYTFSGDSLPARPGGLIISLYRVTDSGSQLLTAQVRASATTGNWSLNRTFTGTGRFGFVVRTGQDLQNAPGSSNVRPTLIF